MNSPSSRVYFLKPVGMYGPIKIGCSQWPEERLKSLMSWSPFPLEIMATTAGGLDLEMKLHDRFASSHKHSEWFEPTTDLIVGISALKSGKAIEEAFDLSVREGSIRSKRYRKRNFPPEMRANMSWCHRVRWAVKKAEEVRGVSLWPPEDVARLTDGREFRKQLRTVEQVARLENFIANAITQSLTRAERWPDWKAAA